jgi:hypothetical protein
MWSLRKTEVTNRKSANILFPHLDLGLPWDSTTRVSRPEKTNPPPRADFSISPSGLNYEIQSILRAFGQKTALLGQHYDLPCRLANLKSNLSLLNEHIHLNRNHITRQSPDWDKEFRGLVVKQGVDADNRQSQHKQNMRRAICVEVDVRLNKTYRVVCSRPGETSTLQKNNKTCMTVNKPVLIKQNVRDQLNVI